MVGTNSLDLFCFFKEVLWAVTAATINANALVIVIQQQHQSTTWNILTEKYFYNFKK